MFFKSLFSLKISAVASNTKLCHTATENQTPLGVFEFRCDISESYDERSSFHRKTLQEEITKPHS